MTIYTPDHFRSDDRAAIAALLHDHPFATLVTPAASGPMVSHLPLLWSAGGVPHGVLTGHCARANAHWRHAQQVESVAIFHGPHAYVSPSWYAEPANAVPTWNYATVHAHGTLEVIDDAVAKRDVLDALVQRFEGDRPAPWAFAMDVRQRDAMLAAIVAFRIPLTRIDAKFKLSQNRSRRDREGVVDGLDAEPFAEAHATAEWMRRYALRGHDAPG
ncbi:MAG: FMN-binding negative transcriptional regulator [Casimicrobiaceae bacterium]